MDKILLEQRNNIIKAYSNGQNIDKIMEQYNINWSTFYNLIAPCLRHDHSDIGNQDINLIIEMYQNGVSTARIGALLNIHHKTVSTVLKTHNIVINPSKSMRKYTIDEAYFDSIDDQYKAYILGLLYADGYNNESKGSVRLSLCEDDKEILLRICELLHYNKPLAFQKNDNKIASNGYTSKNMYVMDIHNKHMSKTLAQYGVQQNKSLILTFPSFLSDDLMNHFLRGYFDGDGSYCHRYADGYGWRDVVTFTSTKSFCNKAKEVINSLSNAQGGGVYEASCHNGVTSVLSFSGARQVCNLYHWLYQNADIYMQRKYALFYNVYETNYSQSA